MKNTLRTVFAPLLHVLERGDEPFAYKQSHRTILVVVGGLFLLLTALLAGLGIVFGLVAALIPGVVFFVVSVTAMVVGTVGTDRAVSKIWGNK